jgi:tetratricopeptide (TPR) repeat protein
MCKTNIKSLFTFLLLMAGLLPAQDPKSLFQQANQVYQQQDFEKAALLYKQIISQGYESKDVYYNLGNCYYRLNQVGQSVLYYEKALKLDPQDVDVRYNLELVNLKVIDRIEIPPRLFLFEFWDDLKNLYSLAQLTRLVALLFAVTVLLIILWLFVKQYRLRRWLISLAAVIGFLTIFWSYILIIQSHSFTEQRQAVILVSSVTVRSAPDDSSTDVFILHEGVKVHLDELRAEWVKISLADGKSGWLRAENLAII